MRLFIAVNFDAVIKSRLLAIQEKIKKQAVRGSFTKPENLHLTLVFIGETVAGLIPEITAIIQNALAAGPVPNAFSVTFTRTGCFRHGGRELWWIGADGDADGLRVLTELRRRIACGLETAGIPFDKKAFKAHITLGREIQASIPVILPEEKVNIPVTRVSLMESARFKGVLTYTEVAGFFTGT